MKNDTIWCEKRNALSQREPTAFMCFGALSVYTTQGGGGGGGWTAPADPPTHPPTSEIVSSRNMKFTNGGPKLETDLRDTNLLGLLITGRWGVFCPATAQTTNHIAKQRSSEDCHYIIGSGVPAATRGGISCPFRKLPGSSRPLVAWSSSGGGQGGGLENGMPCLKTPRRHLGKGGGGGL